MKKQRVTITAVAILTSALVALIQPGTAVATVAGQAFLREDYVHPEADRIEAEFGISLGSGSGSIVLAACAAGTGQIELETFAPDSPFCFNVTGNGWLDMEVTDSFGVRSGAEDLEVTSYTNSGTQTMTVPPGTRRAVGAADGQSTVVELSVDHWTGTAPTDPTATPTTTRRYVAKITSGAGSCTGVLVNPRWVLTAASCMSRTPSGYKSLVAGAPLTPTRIWFDLDASLPPANQGIAAVRVQPYKAALDRDLALVQLAAPASGIPSVALASAAPAAGTQLTATGWGRTSTQWITTRSHTRPLSIAQVGVDVLTLSPVSTPQTFCQGDGGAPLVSETSGAPVLYGVAVQSAEGGCLLSDSTVTAGSASRTDGLAGWVLDTINSNP